MHSYLTAQQSLHASLMAGPDSWQHSSLSSCPALAQLDPAGQLAATLSHGQGRTHLVIASLQCSAQPARQLHSVPLPEGSQLPGATRTEPPYSIAWAPGSTHAALLLHGQNPSTISLLILDLSTGATKLLPLEWLPAQGRPLRAEDHQLRFADSTPARPRLVRVRMLPPPVYSWASALDFKIGLAGVHQQRKGWTYQALSSVCGK